MTGKRIRIAAANLTIFLSWPIELLCLACSALFALARILKWNLPLPEISGPLFAFTAGMIAFPILLYIIYVLSNLAEAGKNFIFMIIGWVLIGFGIPSIKDTPNIWQIYFISILFGIVLENLRRSSYADRRLLTRIDVNKVTYLEQNLPSKTAARPATP